MADLIDRKEAIRAWCLMTCGCKPDECGMTLEEDGAEECEFVEFLWNRPEYDYERNEDEYGRGKGKSDLISREAVIALAKDIDVTCKMSLELPCDGCKFVGTIDTEFPCSRCIRREKDYYEQER